MKLLHLSDTHVHAIGSNGKLLKRREALKKFPDHLIVITGDVTDDGTDGQRENAREIFTGLNCIMVPGNHDYGTIGSAYDPKRAKDFDVFCGHFQGGQFFDKFPITIRREGVLFILLNSCLETLDPFDFACGGIGDRQLTHLKAILDDSFNKEHIKIVALHHHPFIHNDPHMMLLDADRFLRVCYGKVDIMLFGHLHEESQWKNKVGIPLILAAESLYDSDGCKEIIIEGKDVCINRIKLEGCDASNDHLLYRSGFFNGDPDRVCADDQMGSTELHRT